MSKKRDFLVAIDTLARALNTGDPRAKQVLRTIETAVEMTLLAVKGDRNAEATFDRVTELTKERRAEECRDVIQDWQARRLLAQALPDWDFGDPNSGNPNGG